MSSLPTDRYGISDHHYDAFGTRRETSPAARAAIRAAQGFAEGEDPTASAAAAAVRVVRAGRPEPLGLVGELRLEGGGALRLDGGALPAATPLGYHDLHPADGAVPLRLIVAPASCVLPAARAWGWAVQLYAARSRQSWGIGDLGDLHQLAGWTRGLGGGMLLVNPLCAVAPTLPQAASPYGPTSRRFSNPLYLRVEDVPGAAAAGLDLERLAAAGRALCAERRIDRDAVFRLKSEALELLWARRAAADGAAFERYRAELGAPLEELATFCALAERHGGDYRRWDEALRHPAAAAVQRAAEELRPRVRYHAWLQWLLDEQLRRVAGETLLMRDLPIGVDPGGADAWAWQDTLAVGCSVGAPADPFNAEGQNWGMPPFAPHKLRAARYEPFVQTIRASLRHAGGLRIDHVMGLFRLFWIPQGMPTVEGTYVYYPADDLLAITALESQRAGAVVVGEDLGTVEPGVRERLADNGILSYRLVWFEDGGPARFPELAMGAATTHDLPTLAGLWSGHDAAEQRGLGLTVREDEVQGMRHRLRELAGVGDDAPASTVVAGVYRRLGEAPSRLVTATLEDAALMEERPNLPGTWLERANWSVALPQPLEELQAATLPREIAAALRR